MEIATLTAVLEAQVAAFMANMKAADTQINSVERDLDKLRASSMLASKTMNAVKLDSTQTAATRAYAAEMQKAIDDVTASAVGAVHEVERVKISEGQAAGSIAKLKAMKAAVEDYKDEVQAANRAENTLGGLELRKVAQMRDPATGRFMSNRVFVGGRVTPESYVRGVDPTSQEISKHWAEQLRAAVDSAGADWAKNFEKQLRAGGGGRKPISETEQAARRYLRERGLLDDLEIGQSGMFFGGRGGGRGGRRRPGFESGGGRGGRGERPGELALNLASALPGGRRASAAVVTGALGVVAAAGPALIPAAAGLVMGGTAALGALAGAAGTLKLAFADITAAAFTQKKAFDALTPVQQKFVQSLREVDAGFVKTLEHTAAATVLPGLTSAIHTAVTPQTLSVMNQAVKLFADNIVRAANAWAKLFGSAQFQQTFGAVLKSWARYAGDLGVGLKNLFDAFFHLQQAAIPLTNWLDKSLLSLTKWIDRSVKAGQASGALGHFFGQAKVALIGLGHLVENLAKLLGAIFEVAGFKNSILLINLLTETIGSLASFINQNQLVFRFAFDGLMRGAQDVLKAFQLLMRVASVLLSTLKALLTPISNLTHGFIGLRGAIDALIGLQVVKWLAGIGVAEAAVGTAAAGAAVEVGALRGALLGLGAPEIIAAIGAAAAAYLIYQGIRNQVAATDYVPVGPQTTAAAAARDRGYTYPITSNPKRDALAEKVIALRKKGLTDAQIKARLEKGFSGDSGRDLDVTQALTDATILTKYQYGPQKLQLPGGVAHDLAAASNTATKKDDIKAYKEAVAYYDKILKIGNLTRGQKTDILRARAVYAQGLQAFGTPTPFTDTGSLGQLSTALQNKVLTAQTKFADQPNAANLANLVAIDRTAISYLQNLKKTATSASQIRDINKEILSLTKNIATATKSGQATGAGLLPANIATKLADAQGAAASGSLPSLKAELAAEKQALAYLEKHHFVAKQEVQAAKQRAALEKEIARTTGKIADISGNAQASKILGIGGPTVPGVQGLRFREHQILLGALEHQLGGKKHTLAATATALGISPSKLQSESVTQLIKQLQSHGVTISKATLNSLNKINAVLNLALKEHIKLSADVRTNIADRLRQINDSLKQGGKGFKSNYVAVHSSDLVKGLGLTREQKLAAEQRIAQAAAHHMMRPSGGAAVGVPLTPGNDPIGSGPTKVPPKTTPPPPKHPGGGGSSRNLSASAPLHVTGNIYIYSTAENIDQLAREVRQKLLKTARRNTAQTRGPNAGRNIGLP